MLLFSISLATYFGNNLKPNQLYYSFIILGLYLNFSCQQYAHTYKHIQIITNIYQFILCISCNKFDYIAQIIIFTCESSKLRIERNYNATTMHYRRIFILHIYLIFIHFYVFLFYFNKKNSTLPFVFFQNEYNVGLDLSEARASLLSGDVVELTNATTTDSTSMKLVWEVSKSKNI